MPKLSFKQFICNEETKEIAENFGVFKNNAKLTKLRSEHEQRKTSRAAVQSSGSIPTKGTSTQRDEVSDEDVEAAQELIDRSKLPKGAKDREAARMAAKKKDLGDELT